MDDISTTSVSETPTNAASALGFEFRGNGTEFFKICVVNAFLTLLTLGIYSAWATVRNKRYFHANLYLDNDNFRYLAKPLDILKSRVIALFALLACYAAIIIVPPSLAVIAIIFFFGLPFVFNQSNAFNNRMSSYKNIQFRFKASYGQAFMVLYVWPLVALLSVGILYPLAQLRINEYLTRNSAYGTTNFDFNATYKDYAMVFLTTLSVTLAASIPVALLVYFFIPSPLHALTNPFLSIFVMVSAMVIYFVSIMYYSIRISNLFFTSLSLTEHKFEMKLTVLGLTKVLLKNLFFTIITFGLYLPAAKVRMAKYVCASLTLHANGSLEDFSAAENENVSALGEELGHVFDFAQ